MKNIIIGYTPSLLFRRESKERVSSLKTFKREEQASSHSPFKSWARWAPLGAALVALVVLLACPAAPGDGTGPGDGAGPSDGTNYVCANGIPSSLRDAIADGLSRCVSCNPLYKLDGRAGEVGATCQQVAIGEATRIGSVNAFGVVSERNPTGLAAIDGTLYMVGDRNNALYTLDTTTGVATQVDRVSEVNPRGLAFVNGTLYMVATGTYCPVYPRHR